MKHIKIVTDSSTVRQWIDDGLSGQSGVKTRAANEMLIRRRVEVVVQLAEEYELEVTIELVPSQRSLADVLTRVPTRWMNDSGDGSGNQVRQKRREKRKKNAVNASSKCQESHAIAEEEGEMEVADVVAALDDGEEQVTLETVRTIHDKLGYPGIS